jgi:hypothetical protein
MHLTFAKQQEWMSDPAWNNHSASAKCHRVDDDQRHIKSEIAQLLVDESDFDVVKIHILNQFSDHICQHFNLFNVIFELPENAMMEGKHAYRQLNRHEAAFPNWLTKGQKQVFQRNELNANVAIQHCRNDMTQTNAAIK